jgi:hypothetical protein
MSLLPFFQWCDQTAIGAAIRDSVWLFPFIESFHLLALALLGGAVLVVDLHLLGFGLRRQPVRELATELHPWMLTGLAVMIVSGVLMFLSEALKCYESPPFQLKMLFLFLALLFTFTVRRRVTLADDTPRRPFRSALVALVSLTLWTGVGLMGRGIGFW